jgi:flagella basal body P-ring formation protein FlgA
MKRLIVALLIAIISFTSSSLLQVSAQIQQAAGKIVYAVQDIPEGKPISATALEERQIPADKIPTDSVRSISEAAGKVAKYTISKGQILSKHDLK